MKFSVPGVLLQEVGKKTTFKKSIKSVSNFTHILFYLIIVLLSIYLIKNSKIKILANVVQYIRRLDDGAKIMLRTSNLKNNVCSVNK